MLPPPPSVHCPPLPPPPQPAGVPNLRSLRATRERGRAAATSQRDSGRALFTGKPRGAGLNFLPGKSPQNCGFRVASTRPGKASRERSAALLQPLGLWSGAAQQQRPRPRGQRLTGFRSGSRRPPPGFCYPALPRGKKGWKKDGGRLPSRRHEDFLVVRIRRGEGARHVIAGRLRISRAPVVSRERAWSVSTWLCPPGGNCCGRKTENATSRLSSAAAPCPASRDAHELHLFCFPQLRAAQDPASCLSADEEELVPLPTCLCEVPPRRGCGTASYREVVAVGVTRGGRGMMFLRREGRSLGLAV